jgi:Diguanylate cyclase, GGDEF domain
VPKIVRKFHRGAAADHRDWALMMFARERRRKAQVFAGLLSREELSTELDRAVAEAGKAHGELALIYLNVTEIPSDADRDPRQGASRPQASSHRRGRESDPDRTRRTAGLLRSCAERISARLTHSDTLAHLSGPDLAVLMSSIEHPTDAVTCAHGLIGAFRRPFVSDGAAIRARAAAGVAVYPFDGASPTELLRTAEEAARRAADRPSGQLVFSSAELHAEQRRSSRDASA